MEKVHYSPLSYPLVYPKLPEKLAFYDHIGNNPAEGGLFRAGAMDNGDGMKNWFLVLKFFVQDHF